MGRRHLVAAVLVTASLGVAGFAVHAGAATSASAFPPASLDPGRSRVEPAESGTSNAVVAERTERVIEAATSDRRAAGRDVRTLELLGVVTLGAAGIMAVASAMARRRDRRAPTRVRRLAPSRAPPLLLPS